MATLGPPRGPLKGPSRKNHEKIDFGLLFGRPKGSLWGSIFGNFRVFSVSFSSVFFEALFERLLGYLGTPSNHENDGFVYTKPSFSHFHLELRNNRKWCPMGIPLAPLGVPWASFWLFRRVLGQLGILMDSVILPESPPGGADQGGGRSKADPRALTTSSQTPAG